MITATDCIKSPIFVQKVVSIIQPILSKNKSWGHFDSNCEKIWEHEGSIVIGDFFGQDLNIWNSVKQQQ